MNLIEIFFLVFCGVIAGAGIVLALTRKVIYGAFLLFIVLFGMAALFVFAGAEFLAVTQIIVYVGGILILVLFGVMLTQKIREESPRTQIMNLAPGLLSAIALFSALVYLIRSIPSENPAWAGLHEESTTSDVTIIGSQTVTEYLLPFEAISILLLAALIGAAYLARRTTPKKEAS